jgi:hypothetical protein
MRSPVQARRFLKRHLANVVFRAMAADEQATSTQPHGLTSRRPDAAVLRLAGAGLIEAHDEWQVAERRYLSEGSMAKLTATGDAAARPKEVRRATAELVTT